MRKYTWWLIATLLPLLLVLSACSRGNDKDVETLAAEIMGLRSISCTSDLAFVIDGQPTCWIESPSMGIPAPSCSYLGSGYVQVDENFIPQEGPYLLDEETAQAFYPEGTQAQFAGVACVNEATVSDTPAETSDIPSGSQTNDSPSDAVEAEPTPEPAPTEEPPLLAQTCGAESEQGIVAFQGFPAEFAVGQRGWATLNFEDEPTGPPFERQFYWITVPRNIPDAILVHTSRGAYYTPETPQSWFPIREPVTCAPQNTVPAFLRALERLESATGSYTTIFDWEWWGALMLLPMVLLTAAIIGESFMEFRRAGIILVALVTGLTYAMMPHVDKGGMVLLYLFGLVACLAIGNRLAVGEISETVGRTRDLAQLGEEIEALLDRGKGVRRILNNFDFSAPAWWGGINLVWGVLTAEGSPLFVYEPIVAIVINGVVAAFFYLLETIRRGETADYAIYVIAIVGGLATGLVALFTENGSLIQLTAILGTTIVTIIAGLGFGFTNLTAEKRDRLPEFLGLAATMMSVAILIVVRITPL